MSPSPDQRTSALAISSLVCGLFACIPFLGLFAASLGFVAIRRIRASEGHLRGKEFAVVGISFGLFNLLVSIVMVLAWVAKEPPPPPIAIASPSLSGGSPTTPTRPPPISGGESGQMTVLNQITELQIGKIRLVDLPPTLQSLKADLNAQYKTAAENKERLLLFTTTEGCRPCMSIAANLLDPRMQTALSQARLIRVDVNVLGQELNELGVPTTKIPGFYLLGKDLSLTDGIDGGEWDNDTAENAAPILGAFFQGTYRHRREAFQPLPKVRKTPTSTPTRPGGTFLLTLSTHASFARVTGRCLLQRRSPHLSQSGQRSPPIRSELPLNLAEPAENATISLRQ